MKNIKLNAAIKYQSMGFSVIPVKTNKKPYMKWEPYQIKAADEKQIRSWWDNWPNANIGIVTGKVSNLIILDADSQDGQDAVSEFIPETLLFPTTKTPRGFHNWFAYQTGLRSGPSNLKDCDIKTDGGYVIVPPSQNGKGQGYTWLEGLKITDVDPAPMPSFLFETLHNGSAYPARAHTRAYNKERMHSSTRTGVVGGQSVVIDHKRPQVTTSDHIGFSKGRRDNTLFHLTNHLVKGGMPVENIEYYLEFFASHCDPSFPEKEIPIKIESALKRANDRERNLTREIREWIVTTDGHFLTTDVHNCLQLTTRREKKTCAMILKRLSEENPPLIERYGPRAGSYRRIEADCEPEDWQDACTDIVDLWLPFGLSEMALIPPGGLVCIAGEPNAGKTGILLNIAKENRDNWKVHYFSSELGSGAFKRRVSKFSDISPNQFNVKFYPRSDNFSDVIKRGEGNLNIIDYLEIYENFYLVSKHLADIYRKLDGALAILALQKNPGQDDGRGGSFTREKPVLSLSVSPNKVKITKLKEWREDIENPNGMEYHFKLVDGCRFIESQGWHRPIK